MEPIHWEDRPKLRRPVMIAAFEGWNDAGEAASTAATYLTTATGARQIASIDPEEFYDFTSTRPQVRLVDGLTRKIEWPETVVAAAIMGESARDLLFVQGAEPQMRWRSFSETIVSAARSFDVELFITLGALLAEVPHTRPVHVTGTAGSPELVARLGLAQSRYEGPTGIIGVLHDAFSGAGIPSASFWAAVPHYVGQTPSPKAALALVERAAALLELGIDTTDLDVAAAAYERQVSDAVAQDDDATAYVQALEGSDDEGDVLGGRETLAGADTLAAEVERFLREHGTR